MCTRKAAMLLLSVGLVALITLAAANSVMAQKEGLILYLPFDGFCVATEQKVQLRNLRISWEWKKTLILT